MSIKRTGERGHSCLYIVMRLSVICCILLLINSFSYADIRGDYYDQNGVARAYFTGNVISRIDSNINFNFGTSAPLPGFGIDDFSIRWRGEVEIPTSGDYTFITRSDDGVRLWVDGVLVIDNFTDHSATDNTAIVSGLIAGRRYSIVMEHYERGGFAVATLSWEGPGIARQIIPAGALFLDMTPPQLSNATSPCLDGTMTVFFSEEVTQASAENLANYSVDSGVVLTNATLGPSGNTAVIEFFGGSGNGFNLAVNNIVDISGNVMSTAQTVNVPLSGNGLLASIYDQNGIARQYFTGNVFERRDPNVDFNYSTGSPVPGIVPSDDFSIRWQGEVEAPVDGSYIFATVSDDGVRLFLDGNLIIDNFTDHGATTNTSTPQTLVAGQRYSVVMEYYERGGQSVASLQWQGPGISRQPIPTEQLFFACNTIPVSTIAEWRLDEAGWNGSVGEVADSSGNGLNGRAINLDDLPSTAMSNPALSGDPGTCGYGVFDGLADGYVQIDDPGTSSILDLDTEFSVTTWIFPTALPTGVGGLHTIVSKDENFEFHLTPAGQIFWWWGRTGGRLLTSTQTVTLNAWNHVAITYASGQQAIYINGVIAGTGTSTAAITTNDDPVLIGTDLDFHSRRFTGLIDEVRIFGSQLTAVQVNAVMNDRHICPMSSVDHYAISHSGIGLTCEAENVTIVAHDSLHVPVDVGGRSIQISTTSSSSGWNPTDSNWSLVSGGGVLTFPGAGLAEYQFASNEASVTLALANISPALIDIDIVDIANSALTDDDGSLEDPSLSFRETALRFYNDADGNGNADGNDPIASPVISGQVSTPFVLKAIETNTQTGACQARLLGDRDVDLAYECVNPLFCFNTGDVQILGTPIGENDAGSVSNYVPLRLSFDAEGEASLNLRFFDVGNIRLHARADLPATADDPAITLEGSSAVTTVKPANLVITTIETSGGAVNPGTSAAGDGFTVGGSSFRVVVESRNAINGLTPNFGAEVVAEGITLNLVSLVMPAGGNAPALESPASFSFVGTQGRFQNNSVNWPEVGTITINATIADGDYLGSGDVNGSVSGNVGRFYPSHFRLLSSNLVPECTSGGYSYMSDQLFNHRPLDFSYSIAAQIANSTTAQNYDTSLAYPVTSFLAVAEDSNNGIDLNARTLVPNADWEDGVMAVTGGNNGGFSRALVGVNEVTDGPFSSLQFGLKTRSTTLDNVDFLAVNRTMNADSTNDCLADNSCNAVALGNLGIFRFGRLFGNNAHGPETADLAVTLNSQYWNGSEFVIHESDDCTAIAMEDISFDGNDLVTDGNRNVALSSGATSGIFTDFTPGIEMRMSAGDAGLVFTAPGVGNLGSFLVGINLSDYPHLRFDWNQDSNNADDSSLPSINVSFGRYRGHDRIIYWREVLQ